jgi:hypothetical protein
MQTERLVLHLQMPITKPWGTLLQGVLIRCIESDIADSRSLLAGLCTLGIESSRCLSGQLQA